MEVSKITELPDVTVVTGSFVCPPTGDIGAIVSLVLLEGEVLLMFLSPLIGDSEKGRKKHMLLLDNNKIISEADVNELQEWYAPLPGVLREYLFYEEKGLYRPKSHIWDICNTYYFSEEV